MASIFDRQLMSRKDLEQLEEIENAWRNTDDSALRDMLHARAESIRQSYGYSGGADGSEYNPQDMPLSVLSGSVKDYSDAVTAAENNRQRQYQNGMASADAAGKERLRQAYMNSIRDKLGLDQQMRAAGITGGLSESTRAAYDNSYGKLREDIMSDVADTKRELFELAAQSAYDSGKDIAEFEYGAALERADRMTDADNTRYAREQDALDRQFDNQQFEYQKQRDSADDDYREREFAYRQEQDRLDREYKQKKDALELEYKRQQTAASLARSAQSAASSASKEKMNNVLTLIKNGYYSPEFADILGLDPSQLKRAADNGDMADIAWKLLGKGVYDDSFPEILGYSEDVLREYAENAKAGF